LKNQNQEINLLYQMVIGIVEFTRKDATFGVGIAANLAAFSSASASRVAWVRGVCNLHKSVPVMPRREPGSEFSLTSE
jgi:hypothetical protein